jgi:hypothetical protein
MTADTGSADPAYDVDAAFMQVERHERGIHAESSGAGAAEGRAQAPFRPSLSLMKDRASSG